MRDRTVNGTFASVSPVGNNRTGSLAAVHMNDGGFGFHGASWVGVSYNPLQCGSYFEQVSGGSHVRPVCLSAAGVPSADHPRAREEPFHVEGDRYAGRLTRTSFRSSCRCSRSAATLRAARRMKSVSAVKFGNQIDCLFENGHKKLPRCKRRLSTRGFYPWAWSCGDRACP